MIEFISLFVWLILLIYDIDSLIKLLLIIIISSTIIIIIIIVTNKINIKEVIFMENLNFSFLAILEI